MTTDETKDPAEEGEDTQADDSTAAGQDAQGESTYRSEGGDSSDGTAGAAMGDAS